MVFHINLLFSGPLTLWTCVPPAIHYASVLWVGSNFSIQESLVSFNLIIWKFEHTILHLCCMTCDTDLQCTSSIALPSFEAPLCLCYSASYVISTFWFCWRILTRAEEGLVLPGLHRCSTGPPKKIIISTVKSELLYRKIVAFSVPNYKTFWHFKIQSFLLCM